MQVAAVEAVIHTGDAISMLSEKFKGAGGSARRRLSVRPDHLKGLLRRWLADATFEGASPELSAGATLKALADRINIAVYPEPEQPTEVLTDLEVHLLKIDLRRIHTALAETTPSTQARIVAAISTETASENGPVRIL